MPLRKVKGGWKIGSGPTIKTKSAAERVYKAYNAKKHSGQRQPKKGKK